MDTTGRLTPSGASRMQKASLIAAVELRPCIYNRSDPEFKNKTLKKKIWEEIQKDCGFSTVIHAKRTWNHLRSTYYTNYKARRTWEFSKIMEFMTDHVTDPSIPRRKKKKRLPANSGNLPSNGEQVGHAIGNSSDDIEVLCDQSITTNAGQIAPFQPSTSTAHLTATENNISSTHYRASTSNANPIDIFPQSTSFVNNTDSDSLRVFFNYLYATVSKLPPVTQEDVKMDLYNIVSIANRNSIQ